MHCLYVLKNWEGDRHYVGITSDLTARLNAHNAGKVRSTKAYRPWKLVYSEKYNDKHTARIREIFLKKTAKARKALFENINTAPSSKG